jgi:hypothetical protein
MVALVAIVRAVAARAQSTRIMRVDAVRAGGADPVVCYDADQRPAAPDPPAVVKEAPYAWLVDIDAVATPAAG